MDAHVQSILQKTADYIEKVQPLIDQQNENRMLFLKKADQAADLLVSRGLMSPESKQAFVERIKADETGATVWDVVQKMAESVTADGLGTVTQKQASASQDPWERVFFGERRGSEVV